MADDPFRAQRDALEDILDVLESVEYALSKAALDAERGQQVSRRLSHAAAHIKSAMDLVQFSQDKLSMPDVVKERVLK